MKENYLVVFNHCHSAILRLHRALLKECSWYIISTDLSVIVSLAHPNMTFLFSLLFCTFIFHLWSTMTPRYLCQNCHFLNHLFCLFCYFVSSQHFDSQKSLTLLLSLSRYPRFLVNTEACKFYPSLSNNVTLEV